MRRMSMFFAFYLVLFLPFLAMAKNVKEQVEFLPPMVGKTPDASLNERLARMAKIESLPVVPASRLFAAYQDNEAAADLQYKSKPFVLRGRTSKISKNMFGGVTLEFHGDRYGLRAVHAALFETQLCVKEGGALDLCDAGLRASTVKKGDLIELECFGGMMVMNIPGAVDCLVRIPDQRAVKK